MLSLVVLLCPTLYDAMASSPPGSSFHGDSSGKNTGMGCHALLQGINPGIETRSPALQADTLPSTPPGKLYKEIDPLICCGGEKKKYDLLERQFNSVNQI